MGDTGVLVRAEPRVRPAVLGACGALAFYATALGPRPWTDELATQDALRLSLPGLLDRLGGTEAALIPYYLAMWPFAQVSTSVLRLRLPSVAAMTVTAVVVWLLAERLVRRGSGWWATAAFLALPVTSRYAGEARPYALVMCAVALATLALVEGRRGRYVAALAAATGLHLIAVLVVVGHAARLRSRRWWPAALLALPIPVAVACLTVAQQNDGHAWIAPLSWHGVLFETTWRLTGLVFGSTLVWLAALVGALLIRDRLVAWWVLGPPAALLPLSLAVDVWWPRYLLFTVPGLAVGLAAGLVRLPGRWRVIALVVLVVMAAPVQLALRLPDGHQYLN